LPRSLKLPACPSANEPPPECPALAIAAGFLTTLEDWLVSATAAEQFTLLLQLLAALEALPLEAPLLRSSGSAGLLRAVRNLAKSPHKDVSAAAALLTDRWQVVLQGGTDSAAGQRAAAMAALQKALLPPPAPQQAQQQIGRAHV